MKKIISILFVILIVGLSAGLIIHLSSNKTEDIKDNDDVIVDDEKKDDEEKPNNDNDDKKEELKSATIVAVGDIMFHDTQLISAYNNETKKYEFDNVFKFIKKYTEEADIAIGNFETVTAGREHGFRGYPTFNSPIESLISLKDAGFDILATANNHGLDMGKEGIIETIDNIESLGLKNVGTYKENNDKYLIENINDINIGFLSYTFGANGYSNNKIKENEELSKMINIIDEDKIKADIKAIENKGAEVIVVSVHWGVEYSREPSNFQKDLAHKMVDWGVDIILGSHPHVIQKSEVVNLNGENKFIIYSMGNFISNQRRETLTNANKIFTEDGLMVKIDLEKNKDDNTVIKNVEYIPTWVNREKVNDKYKYEIIPIEDFYESIEVFTKETIDKLKVSYDNTMKLMDDKAFDANDNK